MQPTPEPVEAHEPPGDKGGDDGASLEQLERELARGEADLDKVLTARLRLARDKDTEEALDSTSPQPGGGATAQPAKPPAATAARPQSKPPSPCVAACRALASMRRAAEGICRIAGDDETRCEVAQKRVEDAAERVEAAGCVCEDDDR